MQIKVQDIRLCCLDRVIIDVYHIVIQIEETNMGKIAMTHARLTPEIKQQAEAILKELGISISAAYEMFYRQIIAHQGIPFDLRLPNKNTIQAMKDARDGKGTKYESVEKMFKGLQA